jgi:hypothetical protein
MTTGAPSRFTQLLDPVDRIGEVLFGLIMVLTSTTTLSVATAGKAEVKTMILGALGCNLAWGIIDGGMYLLGCLSDRVRGPMLLRALRETKTPEAGNNVILDALPAEIAASLPGGDIDTIRRSLLQVPAVGVRPTLTRDDMLGAAAVCFWVFLSTFPVVIPFFFFNDAQPALRVSNAVAIALLFLCGYAFAKSIGGRPWVTGLAMVAIGASLVAVAVALGG